VAGQRVRARDESERDAKAHACKHGPHADLLSVDLCVRVPRPEANRDGLDHLWRNYFGAVGFEPGERRTEPATDGGFVNVASLEGIEVGTLAWGDFLYVGARPMQEPHGPSGERALAWLGRVMSSAKQAAHLWVEHQGLTTDADRCVVLAYREAEGGLAVENHGKDRALRRQAKVADVDYRTMPRAAWAKWLQESGHAERMPKGACAAAQALLDGEADEVTLIVEGDRYRWLDADSLATPSEAECIGSAWKEKVHGFALTGAQELVDAERRLPDWLTPEEKQRVRERVQDALRALFYQERLHPELPRLVECFPHVGRDALFEAFFREVNGGTVPFRLDPRTGKVSVALEDAVPRLERTLETNRPRRESLENQQLGRGIHA
jgi:hypothetical protein